MYFIQILTLNLLLLFCGVFSSHAFTFDMWKSGMNTDTIISRARFHDVPLHRSGIISINKKFNPKMCVPNRKSTTHFYYKSNLLGEWAKIDLFLTKNSKLLYKIAISWSGPGKTKSGGFHNTVHDVMNKKYGKYKRKLSLIGDTFKYQNSNSSFVLLHSKSSGIDLNYIDIKLNTQNSIEIKSKQTKKRINSSAIDSHKF